MSQALRDIFQDIVRFENKLAQQIRYDYPVGSLIEWKNLSANGGVIKGTVVDHGYRGRVKVLNPKTGKQLWIDASRIDCR